MSASSASYAAAGAPVAAAGDIIDLDRYMRTALRPSRHAPSYTREHLVVDAGGTHRMPLESVSSSISELRPRTYKKHCKRYSHDSGLSDDSYVKRRHKPHRRISNNKYQSSRTEASDSSLREFRATCEKALREQQEQIARVADICNKLVQPHTAQTAPQNLVNVGKTQPTPQSREIAQNYQNLETQLNHKRHKKEVVGAKQNFGQNVTQKSPRTTSTDSSDMTSSTPSFRVSRRKDQYRTDSCKTYNLIMGKLDELSRVFASRRAPPAPAPRRGSSGSVSVCDKMVATTPIVQVLHTSKMSNHKRADTGRSRAGKVEVAAATRYIGEDSVVEQWSDSASEVAPDAFDLENPLHLYAQAKRLHALHASTERRTSPGPGPPSSSSSLCALCRGYWRAVRRYVKQQLFGTCP